MMWLTFYIDCVLMHSCYALDFAVFIEEIKSFLISPLFQRGCEAAASLEMETSCLEMPCGLK